MKQKLVVCIMGQDCEKTIGMVLESVKDADAIVYCDGGSNDISRIEIGKSLNVLRKHNEDLKYTWIENEFNQEDLFAISKQKQFWLKHLQENYKDWWCLYLDSDEVVDDFSEFRKLLEKDWGNDTVFSPRMRHLIYGLASEDATKPVHYVPCRFFKIDDNLFFPEGEHTVLSSIKEKKVYPFNNGVIWHLGYIGGVWDIKKRYDGQISRKETNVHNEEFLNQWRNVHLFRGYPVKQFNPVELPDIILEEFGIDRDELYFAGRGLELKHFVDAINWKEFFKCKTATEFGCGRGPRVFAMNNIGIITWGFEISKYAIDNPIQMYGQLIRLINKDVTKLDNSILQMSDLVFAYDLLEHLNYKDLEKVISKIIETSNKDILISVPVKGDPNLELDSTHIIKEDKEWWIKQFTDKGLKLIPTPEHFLYKEQIMIFEKN